MDGAAIDRALKQRDRDLSLQGWPSVTHGCVLWKVVRYAGPDRPPETVCVWQSERGEPYPLSSGLLDLVDRLDKNSRATYLSEDQLEAKRRADNARARATEGEDLAADYAARAKRDPVLHRSQSLRMSRDKQRARGKKV